MNKIFFPHVSRLAEARPDLIRAQIEKANEGAPVMARPRIKVNNRFVPRNPVIRNELYFSHTSGVESDEAASIAAGIRKIIHETSSGIALVNFGAFRLNGGPYGNADWYQDKATMKRERGYGPQVDLYRLANLLDLEPYQEQKPHMDVFACDRDMSSGKPDNNFVYGAAVYPHYVMSVRRVRGRIANKNLRRLALAVLAAHELGHNFGLVGRNFNRVDNLGPHCNGERGPCLMEQVDVHGARTLEAQTRLIMNRTRWLCDDCLEEADFKKRHLEERGVLW